MGLRSLQIAYFFSVGIDFRYQNLTAEILTSLYWKGYLFMPYMDFKNEIRRIKNSRIHQNNDITCVYVGLSQQTKNICITFIQRRLNVFDVGPTLYKCYTNILCVPWCAFNWSIIRIYFCLFPDICLADAGTTFSRPGIKPLGGLLWWSSASKKQVNCFTHFLRYVLHQQDYLFLIDDTFWKKSCEIPSLNDCPQVPQTFT